MKTKHVTNAERLDAVRLMLEGVALHKDEMAEIGVSDALIQEITEQKAVVEQVDAEQEQKKAELKGASDRMRTEMKLLVKMYGKMRKVLKAFYPQHSWLTFGIEAKR